MHCKLKRLRSQYSTDGPLTGYVKLRVAHAPGMPISPPPPPPPPSLQVNDPDMHHGTCVTHVPWCMPRSLTSGFLWSRWRAKRSQHSRRMGNFTYMVRGPWYSAYRVWKSLLHVASMVVVIASSSYNMVFLISSVAVWLELVDHVTFY